MLHDTPALAKSMDSILASPFTHDQKGELATHQLKLMEWLLQLTALTVVKAACNLVRSLLWCKSRELHKNLSSYSKAVPSYGAGGATAPPRETGFRVE